MAGEEITIPVALMHTGVAMGTVFCVLIVISFVIFLLRFVPKLFEKREKAPAVSVKEPDRAAPKKETSSDSGQEQAQTSDTELVAVIAAAIAASMTEESGVPVGTDGFVIRSIKKRAFL